MMNTMKPSTKQNYLNVWKLCNKFLVQLDRLPNNWEDRTALFCAYLINSGIQSSTLKSYISAIKGVLKLDNYVWDDGKVIFASLTRVCKLANDKVKTRLPIKIGLLELLLFELERVFVKQPYLTCLYRTMFILYYYGMFRVGELAFSQHQAKARDIHIGVNKIKILVVLYTSKTHDRSSRLQEIKISAKSDIKHPTS